MSDTHLPMRVRSVRRRILRMLPRSSVQRLANIRFAWFYSRQVLEEIIIESWPEAGIIDEFANMMDQASHQAADEED